MPSLRRFVCLICLSALAAGPTSGIGRAAGPTGAVHGEAAQGTERTSPVSPDSVAYEVCSALIEQHYARDPGGPLIILQESIDGPEEAEIDHHYRIVLATALEPIPSAVVDAFRGLEGPDSARAAFAPAFRLSRPYRLATQACLDSVFSFCPGGWDVFAGRFPGSRGYITLSRVTLDSGGNDALVYTENHCGMWCAEGTFVYLHREADAWKVVHKLTAWVS